MSNIFHTIILTIGVLAISSCNHSSIDVDVESGSSTNERQQVVIEARLCGDDVDTKTVRKSDGKIYWKPADVINVFFGTDKGVFTSTNNEDALIAQFTGSLLISSVVGMNEGEEDDNCLWGLYPADDDATLLDNEITTSLCENQIGVAGSFNDDAFISLAKNNSFSLAFYNVLTGFRFTFSRSDIKSVKFSGNNNEELAGQLKLSFGDNAKPVVNTIMNGKTELVLTPESGTFEVGEDYYILMIPTLFNNGFTVTMTTENDETGVFSYLNTVNFPRNTFVRKINVNDGIQFRPDLNSGPGKNESVGYDDVNI